MRKTLLSATTLCLASLMLIGAGTDVPPLDLPTTEIAEDGSRTLPVHLIPLYDEYGEPISPYDTRPEPFSTRVTCGCCHDYETIRSGWHFNACSAGVAPGRRGQPWFLVDDKTGTQIPVSYRDWPGTWRPDDLGLTPWEFTKDFARHMPGGGAGELADQLPDIESRWEISGHVEINCLACHNAARDQDQSEWVKQIARENLKWAATAASGLAIVDGIASRLPDSYDPIDGPNPDNPWATPPEVRYDASRFDEKNRAFLDIVGKPAANRCYFCHSVWYPEQDDALVPRDDVHLSGGMACADCHRHGLDHNMVRGYEGEDTAQPGAALTCRECHLGSADASAGSARGGYFMAPRPAHRGLPAVHLEKMTCPSCHSGPLPAAHTQPVRTSRANRLGIHGRAQWYTELPVIASPVFAREADGRIGLDYLMWPAFWADRNGEEVVPLALEAVQAVVDEVFEAEAQEREAAARAAEEQAAAEAEASEGDAEAEPAAEEAAAEQEAPPEPQPKPEPEPDTRLTSEQVAKVLSLLAERHVAAHTPAYVCDGVCHVLESGRLTAVPVGPAAEPYTWSMAHDVRPAAQSLGAGGCTDCHAEDSPFFYAQVGGGSPARVAAAPAVPMYELQDNDPALLAALASVARWQKALLMGGAVLAGILALVLARYALRGIESALRALVATRPK
ncbi:MAG: hypothetical protein JXR94_09600 [Candidatus Hydrogenedentes bacterium]|nr:hypothetical protein [Candidatus Hydrogenedentota bacterium]